jgi:hypothetical protein
LGRLIEGTMRKHPLLRADLLFRPSRQSTAGIGEAQAIEARCAEACTKRRAKATEAALGSMSAEWTRWRLVWVVILLLLMIAEQFLGKCREGYCSRVSCVAPSVGRCKESSDCGGDSIHRRRCCKCTADAVPRDMVAGVGAESAVAVRHLAVQCCLLSCEGLVLLRLQVCKHQRFFA